MKANKVTRVTAKEVKEYIGHKSIFDDDMPMCMKYGSKLPNSQYDYSHAPAYTDKQAADWLTDLRTLINDTQAHVKILETEIHIRINAFSARVKRDILIDRYVTPFIRIAETNNETQRQTD